jgi:hypothetical protein
MIGNRTGNRIPFASQIVSTRALVAVSFLAASPVIANSKPVEVSIQQLIAMPQQFNGKHVSVTGYFDTTEIHACDLRATKKRPNANRNLINIEIPPGSESALKRLTHNFTKLMRVHLVGTFQYRYAGPVKETPVYANPYPQKIVTMQSGYGWEGLWDKQITKISDFHVLIP